MKKGLPGFHGTDHIGITVPNLEEAINFFCNVIGCKLVYRAPAFSESSGTFMMEQLNVHRYARIKGVAFLRCGNNSNSELFEYEKPDKVKTSLKIAKSVDTI